MVNHCDARGPSGTPICERKPVAGGPYCDRHGCKRCGYVIAADYETERMCFECAEGRE